MGPELYLVIDEGPSPRAIPACAENRSFAARSSGLMRVIPACAENSHGHGCCLLAMGGHPRLRGE